jgi:hypothetical protein
MTLSAHTTERLGSSIACALAVAAIAVPFASASASEGRYGPLDPWAYRVLHQADNYGPLDPWADRILHRNSLTTREAATGRPTAATNGFDWADAAVGAGGALGLMLIAAGAINTMRRARGRVAEVGS